MRPADGMNWKPSFFQKIFCAHWICFVNYGIGFADLVLQPTNLLMLLSVRRLVTNPNHYLRIKITRYRRQPLSARLQGGGGMGRMGVVKLKPAVGGLLNDFYLVLYGVRAPRGVLIINKTIAFQECAQNSRRQHSLVRHGTFIKT